MTARIPGPKNGMPRGRPESTSPIGSFYFYIFSMFSKRCNKCQFPIVNTILGPALGASLREPNLTSPIGSLYFVDALLCWHHWTYRQRPLAEVVAAASAKGRQRDASEGAKCRVTVRSLQKAKKTYFFSNF